MSKRITLSLLALLGFSATLSAQNTEVGVEPPKNTSLLTDQQVASVMKQLEELERTIASLRGNTLSAALERLRRGSASDAAALALYSECEKEVNIERKELSREEERRQKEALERQAERNKDTKQAEDNGDFGTAVRLQINYLILSLEASNTEDLTPLLPKLNAFVQDVVSNAERLKGRAGNYLNGGGRGGNPIVTALRLDKYLKAKNWSPQPTSFVQIWTQTVLPFYQEKKPEDLAAQWDACLMAEAKFREGSMAAPEFEIWKTEELPDLRWTRLESLYATAPEKLKTLGGMLELIKANPGHPNAGSWLSQFKSLVTPATPTKTTADSPPSAGTAQ